MIFFVRVIIDVNKYVDINDDKNYVCCCGMYVVLKLVISYFLYDGEIYVIKCYFCIRFVIYE